MKYGIGRLCLPALCWTVYKTAVDYLRVCWEGTQQLFSGLCMSRKFKNPNIPRLSLKKQRSEPTFPSSIDSLYAVAKPVSSGAKDFLIWEKNRKDNVYFTIESVGKNLFSFMCICCGTCCVLHVLPLLCFQNGAWVTGSKGGRCSIRVTGSCTACTCATFLLIQHDSSAGTEAELADEEAVLQNHTTLSGWIWIPINMIKGIKTLSSKHEITRSLTQSHQNDVHLVPMLTVWTDSNIPTLHTLTHHKQNKLRRRWPVAQLDALVAWKGRLAQRKWITAEAEWFLSNKTNGFWMAYGIC